MASTCTLMKTRPETHLFSGSFFRQVSPTMRERNMRSRDMLRKILAGTLALLIITTSALADTIPFTTSPNGLMLIDIKINGVTTPGLLDTGSAGIVIPESFMIELANLNKVSKDDLRGSAEMYSAGGVTKASILKTKTIELAGKTLVGEPVVVFPGPIELSPGRSSAIIGQSALRHWKFVTINFDARTITFTDTK